MRKQYHFRPSEAGLRAWDVHKLLALSADLPIFSVPLNQIRELDQNYWFAYAEVPTCRAIVEHMRLMQETDLRYPIILSADGGVMDGMHRAAKALLYGHVSIMAVQFTTDPEPDFIGIAPDELPYDQVVDEW
ncbi:hypothetical protein [Glaciimonas soli]|uniref:ParB-like nuclease family protein n=1 Tax=Glaciimonas soli TaxID=2590999 RepID=A0A843YQF4_9BURK|nr:hypothetical protein [Glaciimonas soli]MQQ99973.1 hypothetical protein [Glaciimonas soli]